MGAMSIPVGRSRRNSAKIGGSLPSAVRITWAASIGMILQQKAPADNFATHVKIIAVTAATAKKAFEPKVLGGDAKPDVWNNWADFSKKMDNFVAATDDLAKAAASGGLAAAQPKVQGALQCKGCHDTYRVPKK